MGRRKLLDNEQVLRAIRNHIVHAGAPPTIEELRSVLGVKSTRTIQRYLELLEEQGLLDRWAGARGMKLRDKKSTGLFTKPVPVMGVIAAGALTLSDEYVDTWVHMPTTALKPASSRFFLLRVRGDSMNKARLDGQRIEDGDLVLVRSQATANPGDIVVSLVDGESTLKRLSKGPGYFVLKPESDNSVHHPIVVDGDKLAVQGVATKLIKKGTEFLTT